MALWPERNNAMKNTITIKQHKNRIKKDEGMRNVIKSFRNEYCDFIATDNDGFTRHIFYASVMGLDWPENSHCHVLMQLYYETHRAMDIPFATKKDAWEFVHSQGKIDHRIIKKEALSGNKGWKLTLKV